MLFSYFYQSKAPGLTQAEFQANENNNHPIKIFYFSTQMFFTLILNPNFKRCSALGVFRLVII